MTRTPKAKTSAIAVRVPQNRADAAEALKLIGERQRQIGRIEADMNDSLTRIKEAFEADAVGPRAEAKALLEGLKVWCEANRASILDNGTKTADLGTGKVSWRLRPRSVTVKGVEAVIQLCDSMGFTRFLRVKTELNKEAMLEEADLAGAIPGVSIGSAGEEFIAEPFAAELAVAS